jgi:hypothetical protein
LGLALRPRQAADPRLGSESREQRRLCLLELQSEVSTSVEPVDGTVSSLYRTH